MKILQVINGLGHGGAERLLYNFVRAVRRDHPDVDVEVCTIMDRGVLGERLAEEGVVVHHIATAKWNLAGGARRIRTLVRSGGFHVVHAHLFPAGYCVSLGCCFGHHPPVLFTEHSTWNRRRGIPFLKPLESLIYARFDRILAISEECAASLRSWLPDVGDRLSIVENGVPIPESTRAAFRLADPPHLLTVGRLVPHKGIDVAIGAVRILSGRGVPVSLTVVGDGPERGRLTSLARGLPVRFVGYQDESERFLERCDVLLVPSRREGFGLVAVEGMSMGIPVIASGIDALARIVEDGVSGVHARSGDEVDLARKIERVLGDEALRMDLSKNGRARAIRHWSIKRYVRDLLDVYASMAVFG